MMIDLRLGDWRTVLDDVTTCDALICDPPYLGACASAGGRAFKDVVNASGPVMDYAPADAEMLVSLCEWSRRCTGWCVFFNDFDGAHLIRKTLLAMKAVVAEPIAWVKPPAMSPARGSIILPQKGTEFIVCARFVKMSKWHTHLVGSYGSAPSTRPQDIGFTGGKPIDLMRAIVRDYSRPGDLIVDPFCGSGTTAMAAAMEGRHCITSEFSLANHAIASRRLGGHYQPGLFTPPADTP